MPRTNGRELKTAPHPPPRDPISLYGTRGHSHKAYGDADSRPMYGHCISTTTTGAEMPDIYRTSEMPKVTAMSFAVAASVSFWYQTTVLAGNVPEGLAETTFLYPACLSVYARLAA